MNQTGLIPSLLILWVTMELWSVVIHRETGNTQVSMCMCIHVPIQCTCTVYVCFGVAIDEDLYLFIIPTIILPNNIMYVSLQNP